MLYEVKDGHLFSRIPNAIAQKSASVSKEMLLENRYLFSRQKCAPGKSVFAR